MSRKKDKAAEIMTEYMNKPQGLSGEREEGYDDVLKTFVPIDEKIIKREAVRIRKKGLKNPQGKIAGVWRYTGFFPPTCNDTPPCQINTIGFKYEKTNTKLDAYGFKSWWNHEGEGCTEDQRVYREASYAWVLQKQFLMGGSEGKGPDREELRNHSRFYEYYEGHRGYDQLFIIDKTIFDKCFLKFERIPNADPETGEVPEKEAAEAAKAPKGYGISE